MTRHGIRQSQEYGWAESTRPATGNLGDIAQTAPSRQRGSESTCEPDGPCVQLKITPRSDSCTSGSIVSDPNFLKFPGGHRRSLSYRKIADFLARARVHLVIDGNLGDRQPSRFRELAVVSYLTLSLAVIILRGRLSAHRIECRLGAARRSIRACSNKDGRGRSLIIYIFRQKIPVWSICSTGDVIPFWVR